MDADTAMVLGEIKGSIEGIAKCQDEHTRMLTGIDDRLRKVETKAAVHGAFGGGVVGLGMAVIVELIKARLEVAG